MLLKLITGIIVTALMWIIAIEVTMLAKEIRTINAKERKIKGGKK